VMKEITGGQVKHWPKKELLLTGSLSVKYVILNRIGAANCAPTNHRSGITPMLAKLIFLIGTKGKLNFGEYVFNQTMKHADSFAARDQDGAGTSTSLTKASRNEVLAELMKVSKALGETIRSSTIRKMNVPNMFQDILHF
ncbi:envelope-like protein, partial [Trifolium medium]|nr:envelope-like protein [Trifolium medium]